MVWLVAMSLWLFLSDATFTLLRRVARGERVDEAHREHLYQRLVVSGLGHRTVSLLLGTVSLGLTILAFIAWRQGQPLWAWCVLAVAATVFGLEVSVVHGREVGAARRGQGGGTGA